MTSKIVSFRDYFIQKRYWIAGIIFLSLVFFKVSGSSIAMWDTVINEQGVPVNSQKIIFGEPRAIRSDEWLVQTPFSFSQTKTEDKLINDTLSVDGQNMILAYNSPMKNIFIVSKPFNWGYVLFGEERGLSWSWCLKFIGIMLLSFELGLILTKRNKNIALLSSLWITLSPAIQWWFVSPVGDLVFYTLGIIVSTYYYFYKHNSTSIKIINCFLFVCCATGFVLVLYPPLQVPLAYLILFFYLAFYFEFRRKKIMNKTDIIFIGVTLLAVIGIVVSAVWVSKDGILALLHTAYPGTRFNSGGGGKLPDLFLFLTNWLIPYRDITFINNSEVSMFYNFLPIVLVFCPYYFIKDRKNNLLGICLYLAVVINLAWIFFPFPKIIAKVTLLSYVTIQRAYLSLGFSSMLLSIWLIWKIWETKKPRIIVGIISTILIFIVYRMAIYHSEMVSYFSNRSMIITLIGFSGLVLFLLLKRKILFSISLLILIIVSGVFVNPVNIGTGSIYNKKLPQTIQEINTNDPNQTWLSDVQSPVYNLLPALGVKSVNSVVFYPNLKTWEKIDPTKKFEEVYNRYAHIQSSIGNYNETTFELLGPDAFIIKFSVEDLKKYDIKYIVSSNPDLQSLSTRHVTFNKKYGPDKNNYSIYLVNYNEE